MSPDGILSSARLPPLIRPAGSVSGWWEPLQPGGRKDIPFAMSRFKSIWLAVGAKHKDKKAFVYRFRPEKDDYYQPFDATVSFPSLNQFASLVDGAAFLVRD